LQPDLVIQITFRNDLDDSPGVRGFGVMATYSHEHPERADSLIRSSHPEFGMNQHAENLLHLDLDHESRQRFTRAFHAIHGLREALGALPEPAEYLLVVHWEHISSVFDAAGHGLPPARIVFLPREFWEEPRNWVDPSRADNHWNARGGRLLAELLCGWILERGLLPRLELAGDRELVERAAESAAAGLAEARDSRAREFLGALRARIVSRLEFDRLTPGTAAQVHGGIDSEGLVGPYASLVLKSHQAPQVLSVLGSRLADAGLASGSSVRVLVEDADLGSVPLSGAGELVFEASLPEWIGEREYVAVRFVADDYVYRGQDLRHCVSLRLRSIELRPIR
jgi:hypothetical protein